MRDGNATHSVNGASTTKEGGLWGKFADFILGTNAKPEPSRLTRHIEEVIRKHPGSKELLNNPLQISRIRDMRKPLYQQVTKTLDKLEIESKNNTQLNRELKIANMELRTVKSVNDGLIEEIEKLVRARVLLENSFQAISDREGTSPILWGQSIDALVDQMPDALDFVVPVAESPLFPKAS